MLIRSVIKEREMREAQNVIEVLLIASFVTVISFVILQKYNDMKISLAGLSQIKDNPKNTNTVEVGGMMGVKRRN